MIRDCVRCRELSFSFEGLYCRALGEKRRMDIVLPRSCPMGGHPSYNFITLMQLILKERGYL